MRGEPTSISITQRKEMSILPVIANQDPSPL